MQIHKIFNITPYSGSFSSCLDETGAGYVVAILKATFRFSDTAVISVVTGENVVPIFTQDIFYGDPVSSRLRYPSDNVPRRRGTDIILNGQAYGHGKRPITAGFRVGNVVKQIMVSGFRHYDISGNSDRHREPAAFQSIPLHSENASGGSDVEKNSEGSVAAVIGAIPTSCPQRYKFSGTYDEKWLQTRNPLFPLDFDERFYNGVPQDQVHAPKLTGGEMIVLDNVHPRNPHIQLEIPRLSFTTKFHIKDDVTLVPMVMDQLLIEPDESRFVLTFRSSHPIGDDWQYLRSVYFESTK